MNKITIADKEFDPALVKEAVNGAAEHLERWPDEVNLADHWRIDDCL